MALPLPPGTGFSIRTVGQFVKMLAHIGVGENRLPGLAAMMPKSELIAKLNGGIDPVAIANYRAVTSSFVDDDSTGPGFARKVGQYALGRLVHPLFEGESNDLVVNTASMSMFGSMTEIAPEFVYALSSSDQVYHTTYFAVEQVVEEMSYWLDLEVPFPVN
jgi:hypothetical protein